MNIYDKLIFVRYLDEGETLHDTVHKHWIDVLKPMFKVSFFGVIPPLFLLLALVGVDLNNPIFFLAVAWLFFGFFQTILIFFDWYYDAWLLTDQGVISVRWEGIWKRNVSRTDYGAIDGVAYELNGFMGVMLKFGNIVLQKTSSGEVLLPNAANPRRAEAAILEYQEQFTTNKNSTDSEAIKSLLAEVIKKHVQDNK